MAASSLATLVAAASLATAAQAADATATAADSTDQSTTATSTAPSAGGEGQHVSELVVTAESTPVTATAPTKGSLDEVQPESIITRQFIQQATPETGGWTTVLAIAPSIAGISSNAGGAGDYQTVTLRGFQDGFFNLTFDGIAFGDTNNPTHHSNDYFPASTIGAVIVDRGPGAAGDLGQANFGGAIHFFTPDPTAAPGYVQRVTGGSYGTWGVVSTINTGEVSQLGGARLLINWDAHGSDGELSDAGGKEENILAKMVVPIGDKANLTLFASHEIDTFNFEDSSGPGETWQQVELLGKNFSMTDDPLSEHFTGFNYEIHRTDFEYADLKGQFTPSFSGEDQAYTYWYSNKTHSSNDLTGDDGPDLNGLAGTTTTNTSPPKSAALDQSNIGGYDKLNEYRVFGNIVRLNQDWSFGTLKIGGVVEGSRTFRHNCKVDLTLGPEFPDDFDAVPPNSSPNCGTLEESSWFQWQAFADFYWRPTSNLTITPGFKYVDFTRNVHAAAESVAGEPSKVGGVKLKAVTLNGTNNYQSPLYFLTANYKLTPDWAVYGQFATSFLIPELSDLYVTGINLNTVKPQYTTNYQLGTVYTKGRITADADVYYISATNLQVGCNIPLAGGGIDASFCNTGSADFYGVEGEAAYAFPWGLTLFANGSLNYAIQNQQAANAAQGIAAAPKEPLAGAPRWTDAVGALYGQGPWTGSLTFKQVGTEWQYNTSVSPQVAFHLPSYFSLDASAGYFFNQHFGVKVQAFNLLNDRQINSFTPGANSLRLGDPIGSDGHPDSGIYTFQGGRLIEATLIGKF